MTPMACPEHLIQAIRGLVSCEPGPRGHVITMPSIYPSGEWIQVTISEKDGVFDISDGARGLAEIRMTGMQHQRPGIYLARAARSHGVEYVSGVLRIEAKEQAELPDAFARVASASLEGVVRATESYRFPNVKNFKFAFDSFINDRFPSKFHKEELAGEARSHPFDYVHRDGTLIVLDPLQHNDLSINRAYTAHSDIRRSARRPDSQIIVFDRLDGWIDHDLKLLENSGAEVLSFEMVEAKLPRLLTA
jgi:hypothetical protein